MSAPASLARVTEAAWTTVGLPSAPRVGAGVTVSLGAVVSPPAPPVPPLVTDVKGSPILAPVSDRTSTV